MTGAHAQPGQPWPESRLTLAVTGVGGQTGEIELKFRRDTLEIWYGEHCYGVLDRDWLREWMARPTGAVVVDEVRLTAAGNRYVVLRLGNSATRTFAPAALTQLRQRV